MKVVGCKVSDDEYTKLITTLGKKGLTVTNWLRPIILQSISKNPKEDRLTNVNHEFETGLYKCIKDAIKKYENEVK